MLRCNTNDAPFSVKDNITQADQEKLNEIKPIEFWVSCNNGLAQPGIYSLGKNLLDKGPGMVVAVSGVLKADDANALIKKFLEDPNRDTDPVGAFYRAIKAIFPDGLIPGTNNGADQFFKFIVGKQLPTQSEA